MHRRMTLPTFLELAADRCNSARLSMPHDLPNLGGSSEILSWYHCRNWFCLIHSRSPPRNICSNWLIYCKVTLTTFWNSQPIGATLLGCRCLVTCQILGGSSETRGLINLILARAIAANSSTRARHHKFYSGKWPRRCYTGTVIHLHQYLLSV